MRPPLRFDLDTVLRTIHDDRITIEMAVAPIALAMAAHPDLESFDRSSLRQPVGPGETGEIQGRAASLMAGYLPAEANADAFADGWYRTGDVGTIDADGGVRLTDRRKEMIKVSGFQVAPAEVEAVLHGHPAVADCAVFGLPDPVAGEAIIEAVTRAQPATPGEPADEAMADELTTLVAARLARFARPGRSACARSCDQSRCGGR
jgi:acyl-CoA synthetase (AMP-forming)/AMP-acid ligase II